MTKKEKFINEVEQLIKNLAKECVGENTVYENPESYFTPDALDFWNGLQMGGDSGKPAFTPNGALVLNYMKDNKDTYNNLFKAKDIGEGLSISSRTASGAMRKLVNDGYVEKVGESPTVYSLTQKGIEVKVEESTN